MLSRRGAHLSLIGVGGGVRLTGNPTRRVVSESEEGAGISGVRRVHFLCWSISGRLRTFPRLVEELTLGHPAPVRDLGSQDGARGEKGSASRPGMASG